MQEYAVAFHQIVVVFSYTGVATSSCLLCTFLKLRSIYLKTISVFTHIIFRSSWIWHVTGVFVGEEQGHNVFRIFQLFSASFLFDIFIVLSNKIIVTVKNKNIVL